MRLPCPSRSRLVGALLATAALVIAPDRAVAASCSFTGTTSVALGQYDVFATHPLESVGGITYRCTGVGENDLIYIQLSRGGSSTYFPRRLSGGALSLEYNLFLDAARTQVWGDGTGGTGRYGPIRPAEGDTTVNVFARAEAGQNVSIGTYTDSLVVTILY